ncbi:MAG: hypothetical protein AB7N76_36835 [Planctomycetota bacterium]
MIAALRAKRTAPPERYRPQRRTAHDWLETLRRSPAYGLAGFLHLLILVALSFWTIAVYVAREARPVEVRIIPARAVNPSDHVQDHTEALQEVARTLDKALAGADTDSPFAEAAGNLAGALTGEANKLLGLAGGQGGGLGRGGSGGDSRGSRTALNAGLDWLARHRTREGVWAPVPRDHHDPSTIPASGAQLGQTGLAVVSFLAAGHEPGKPGPYQELLRTARAWLLALNKDGSFPQRRYNGLSNYYEQAIGLLALAECLQREDDPATRQAVERSVRFLTKTRTKDYGWRYTPGYGTDTSVTGWVLLALKSAEHAGVKVPPENYEGVRAWLRDVTDPETGRTGYTRRRAGDNLAMTATGLFLRILLGEDPQSPVNLLAARIVEQARVQALRGGLYSNPYEVYYGALALYQVGGRRWRRFNPRVRDALVGLQVGGRGCERGSWLPGSSWVDERVGNTCFAVLTLETYYRYLPQHGRTAAGGEQALEEANQALEKAGPDKGALLAASAAYARAQRLLEQSKGDWDLVAEALLGQARVALALDDLEGARAQLAACYALVPAGELAPEGAAELRARLALLETVQKLEAAYARAQELLASKEPAPAPDRQLAADDLRKAARLVRLRISRMSLDEEAKARVLQMVLNAEGAAASLLLAGDRDENIAQGLLFLERRAERPPQLDPFERQLLVLLIQRAHERFLAAQRQKSFALYAQAVADREEVRKLDPRRRASPIDLRQLGPALERLELAQLAALVGLDRRTEAVARLRAYLEAYPEGALRPQAEAIERGLLLEDAAGLAAPEQARLLALLEAARQRGDALSALERLYLADADLAGGRSAAAERLLRAVLEQKPAPALRVRALLGLSRVYRAEQRVNEAWALLEGLSRDERDRLDVILERCLVLRARGEPDVALREYVGVLRAIEHEEPARWWEVAEETASAYLEAKQVRAARAFMEGLREKDRTFGGDEARRKRMLALMRHADNLRTE